MLNLAVFSCFSIIGPVYQNTFLGQVLNLLSQDKRKKNKKRYDNLKDALVKLEQVKRDLEDKINGQPTLVDVLALRLIDIVECRKNILSELKNHDTGLITVDEKLIQLKEKWEKRINGQSVNIEELKVMISDVEACMEIIVKKMNSLLPAMPLFLN